MLTADHRQVGARGTASAAAHPLDARWAPFPVAAAESADRVPSR
jgi:hypothetical protein